MFQLFFLTVLCNIVTGLFIASDPLKESFKSFEKIKSLFASEASKLILGGVSMVIGVFSLLNFMEGTIPVIGDLIPSLYAVFMGFSVLVAYFKEKTTSAPGNFVTRYDSVILKNGSVFGLGGVLVGLLHFIIPSAILL